MAEHPLVFATFTAPSFGPVHAVRESGGKRLPCRPRTRGDTCPHGRSLGCGKRHADDDRCLGEAICPDCFQYERCALWNLNLGRLFRRTRTYVERELARQAGLTQKAARQRMRVSYVKVAEFQRRGVVHFHVLWRLDCVSDELAPPPEGFNAQLLADAIATALPRSTVPAEDDAEPYRWGEQHEVRALHAAKSDHNLIHISAWHFAGRGYPKAGDALLAASSHARAREMRRIACEEAIRGDDEGRAGSRDERR